MNICTFIVHRLPKDVFQIPPHRQCETLGIIFQSFSMDNFLEEIKQLEKGGFIKTTREYIGSRKVAIRN